MTLSVYFNHGIDSVFSTARGAGGPLSLSPNAKQVRQGSHGGNSHLPSVISIPQRIHQMAANHLTITNSVLYSYEYWEVADNLAKENKGETPQVCNYGSGVKLKMQSGPKCETRTKSQANINIYREDFSFKYNFKTLDMDQNKLLLIVMLYSKLLYIAHMENFNLTFRVV